MKPIPSKCLPVTAEELKWIADFKKLAKKCPKKLWLFSASGMLCVMKTPENGEEMGGGQNNEGVNKDNVIDTVKIKNDGGDW